LYFVQSILVFAADLLYRDKKFVGVFVRFFVRRFQPAGAI
jgi:hypothetical protein